MCTQDRLQNTNPVRPWATHEDSKLLRHGTAAVIPRLNVPYQYVLDFLGDTVSPDDLDRSLSGPTSVRRPLSRADTVHLNVAVIAIKINRPSLLFSADINLCSLRLPLFTLSILVRAFRAAPYVGENNILFIK